MSNQRIIITDDDSVIFEDADEKSFSVLGVQRATNSGNPNYDPATGQFASGPRKDEPAPKAKKVPVTKESVRAKRIAIVKRQDAVRNIARKFVSPTPEDVIEYAQDKTIRELTPLEIQQIIEEARAQRMSDIVDVIDGLIKKQGFRALTQDKGVIIKATKQWVKATLASMSKDEVYDAYRRLLARGCTEEEIANGFFKKFSDKKQTMIKDMLGSTNGATAGLETDTEE